MNLKVGYVVCLNYDVTSPSMTVAEILDDVSVMCLWFDDSDTLHEGVFPAAVLEVEFDGEEEEAEEAAEAEATE